MLLSGMDSQEMMLEIGYEKESYQKIIDFCDKWVSDIPFTLDGESTVLNSDFYQSEENRYSSIGKVLQLNDKLLFAWDMWDSNKERPQAILEMVDSKTGEPLHNVTYDTMASRVQKTDYKEYDYRIYTDDGIVYFNSANKDDTIAFPFPSILANNFIDESNLYFPDLFDIDPETDQVAYCSKDGIYLTNLAGADPKKVLDNADAAEGAYNPYDGAEGRTGEVKHVYTSPIIMDNGKKLVSTVYMLDTEGYDYTPSAVTVLDIATGEKNVYYLYRNDSEQQEQKLRMVNVETGEVSLENLDMNENNTFDQKTFVRVDMSRDDNGNSVSTLVSYGYDTPDETTKLLSMTNGWMWVNAVTEDYVVVSYSDGLDGAGSKALIVPLKA